MTGSLWEENATIYSMGVCVSEECINTLLTRYMVFDCTLTAHLNHVDRTTYIEGFVEGQKLQVLKPYEL